METEAGNTSKTKLSDPRKTALAKASSIYKRQTRPLVREGAPQNKTVNAKQ
jgi:hypothetical protein